VFSTAFLLGPAAILLVRSFQANEGGWTLLNYQQLTDPQVLEAYGLSVRISLVTAIIGGVFGFLMAWAVIYGGLPRPFRSLLTTFSGVASNFAGVPLAAAFIFTLGRIGLITALFGFFGVELYQSGFSLYNFWGLSVVYMFFQFPLMVLTITPALEGLKKEWKGPRRTWEPLPGSTGGTSHCRCCCLRSSAPSSCSSATPLALTPRHTP
jgi:putative spermidine/putrescine transport system permease protein